MAAIKSKKKPDVALFIGSESDLSAAFSEWDRRYREEPERFQNEARRLLDKRETPKTYGDACAPYLLSIISELSRPAKAKP